MKIPSLQYYHIAEGLTAFSSMRKGGYSTGRYGEFNINRYCGDSDEAIRQNREALCRLLDITDDHLLMPHQVCAVHAGWRGTVMRIVEQSIARMTEVYGTNPADLIAQIGPGIHLESFEVGDEVYQAFEDAGFNMNSISKKYPSGSKLFTFHSSLLPSKWHLDLPECNRLQLISAGVPESQVSVSPVCTYMQSDTYFSARRLGIESGRIFTGIILRRRD